MRDDWKEIIEKEMMEDAERIMEEVNADPTLKDVKAPEEIHDKLFAQIHEYEKQRVFEQLSEEDRELIRLGKVYKKHRKLTKYLILVAAVLVVLAAGTVCIGEGEKIFSVFTTMFAGKERTSVSSENAEPTMYIEEEEVYEEIKKTYGFSPVRLGYLPDNTVFSEAIFSEDMQSVNVVYEINDKTNIIYIIRPNYREASLGIIVEDEKVQEYQMIVRNVGITLTEYNVEETSEKRWMACFEHHGVQYLLRMTHIEQEEVEKIVDYLGF